MFISIQLYVENGLTNHAAASAYGFLLSLTPMLLIMVFFFSVIAKPSPEAISVFIGNIPLLSGIFDKQWITGDFFSVIKSGIPGVISVLSIFWAARILALSIRLGLNIIFPAEKNQHPVKKTLAIIAIDSAILFFILIFIMSSRTALNLYRLLDFVPKMPAADGFISIVVLGIISFLAYLIVPTNSPRKLTALQGALFCTFTYFFAAMALKVLLDTSKLNFLYGTLGSLIVLLIHVYFFFTFFFLGAQFAFVSDSFDALLFSKLRQIRRKADTKSQGEKSAKRPVRPDLLSHLFVPEESNLNKYLRIYKQNEIIISQGEPGDDVYYLLKGEVEILLSSPQNEGSSSGILNAGSFFGEMSYLLSEDRSATIRAKTDVSVFVLPPHVFDAILKYDTSLDRDIIEHMSRRLKNTTAQLITLKSGSNV